MGVGERAPERGASRVTAAAYCRDERCAMVNVSAWGFAGGRLRGGREGGGCIGTATPPPFSTH